MTYFKYAEREAPQQINWAEVGKSVSDTLIAERDRRETLKKEIDDASREFGQVLQNAPMGQSVTFNNWVLNGANDASQLLLQQEREMKAGRLDYKDFIAFRQNMLDSTENLYNVVNDYNAEFDRKLERAKNGESSNIEQYLMEQVEGFQNFSETGIYWDPMKGSAAIARKERDAEGNITSAISKNPNDVASIQSLQARIKRDYNRYDVEGNMTTIADSVGEELMVIYENSVATEANPMQKEAWNKAETDLVNSVLTSPDNAASVLADYVERTPDGKEFYVTEDEAEAAKNDNAILLRTDNNGNVVASFDHPNGEKQLEMAREALRANLRIKLDRKQTAIEKSTRTPSEYEYKRMDGLSREVSHANALGKLYYGGENEVASASGFIKGLEGNEDVRKIFRTPEGLVVQRTVEGGITEETYPFVDENGILMPQEEWIQSVYTTLTPGQDLDLALAQSSYRADREFNPNSRYSFDINMRPDVQPIGDLQFEIGKEKFGVADLFSPVEDKDIVVSAAEDAERVLQKLPSSMTQNLEVRELDSDELDDVSTDGDAEDAIVINMPHVLTAPLIVPSGDKFAGQVRGIVTDLYNAAAEGKRRAPASYKNFFDDGIFSQYNNQYSAGKFEYPEEAITGEVYSRAETDATQTEQFRVLEIEELQEEAAAEMPSMIGGTPVNQVDAGAVEPTATAEDEVDAMLEEFRNQQTAATETAEVANEAEAEVATQADEAAKKKDDAVVTAIEEEAPLDDAEKADRRMVTKVFEDKKSQLSWPTTTRQIVRGFGAQQDPNNPQVTLDNKGVDIRTEPNTPVKPSFPGVVTKVFDVAGAGKTVIVSHGNYRTVYSNLKATDLNVGDEITSSDTIGSVVDTTGTPALHFEVWKVEGDSVSPQNPQEWLSSE